MIRCQRGFLGLLILCAFGGCGKSLPSNRDVYPARGKVLLNGRPIRYATIHLDPVDSAIGNECEGLIGGDGTFQIRTYANNGVPDGAVPGEYKIWIEPYSKAKNGKIKSGSPSDVPKKYQDTHTSGLKVTINAEENTLKVELK
jgi:hypothetical protein